MQLLTQIPENFYNFLIIVVFSLLIGFEQRKLQSDKELAAPLFGTDRTFTFIGILGFILYLLDTKNYSLFILGGALLGVLLGIYYYNRIKQFTAFGFTSIIVALITYGLGPIVITQPRWLTILIVVTILILAERKEYFKEVSTKISIGEFVTLAKFLIIAGVILPLLPKEAVIPVVNISAYEVWITVVVVSAISYLSYILQRFVFKKSGVLLSGILGGMYSSTAATLIISRKSREAGISTNQYAASITAATTMMYVRILILVFIFNQTLAKLLTPYFVILIFISIVATAVIYLSKRPQTDETSVSYDKNPLELKMAALFAVLFILFTLLTTFTLQNYGSGGLNFLSYIIGFTDIDPFLLNIFQGQYSVPLESLAKATFQAIISNNILKTAFTLSLADKHTKRLALAGMAVITICTLIINYII